jgi:hypothetical protein
MTGTCKFPPRNEDTGSQQQGWRKKNKEEIHQNVENAQGRSQFPLHFHRTCRSIENAGELPEPQKVNNPEDNANEHGTLEEIFRRAEFSPPPTANFVIEILAYHFVRFNSCSRLLGSVHNSKCRAASCRAFGEMPLVPERFGGKHWASCFV